MSRKAKLAGLLQQTQSLGDPFADGSKELEALGDLVRQLLITCKSPDYSDDAMKKALQGVKASFQRLEGILTPKLLQEANEVIAKFARACVDYAKAKRSPGAELSSKSADVHNHAAKYKDMMVKLRIDLAQLDSSGSDQFSGAMSPRTTQRAMEKDPTTNFLHEVISPRIGETPEVSLTSSSPSTPLRSDKDESTAAKLRSSDQKGMNKRDSFGGGQKCTHCGKAVFFAERKEYQKMLFHVSCFNHWFKEHNQSDTGVWGAHYSKPNANPAKTKPEADPKKHEPIPSLDIADPMETDDTSKPTTPEIKSKDSKSPSARKHHEKEKSDKSEKRQSSSESKSPKTKSKSDSKDKEKVEAPEKEKEDAPKKSYSHSRHTSHSRSANASPLRESLSPLHDESPEKEFSYDKDLKKSSKSSHSKHKSSSRHRLDEEDENSVKEFTGNPFDWTRAPNIVSAKTETILAIAGDAVNVWDTRRGQLLGMFIGHSDNVNCVAVVGALSSRPLVVSSSSAETLVWDLATQKVVHDIEIDYVLKLASDPENDLAIDVTIGLKEKKKVVEMQEKWVLENGRVVVSKD